MFSQFKDLFIWSLLYFLEMYFRKSIFFSSEDKPQRVPSVFLSFVLLRRSHLSECLSGSDRTFLESSFDKSLIDKRWALILSTITFIGQFANCSMPNLQAYKSTLWKDFRKNVKKF